MLKVEDLRWLSNSLMASEQSCNRLLQISPLFLLEKKKKTHLESRRVLSTVTMTNERMIDMLESDLRVQTPTSLILFTGWIHNAKAIGVSLESRINQGVQIRKFSWGFDVDYYLISMAMLSNQYSLLTNESSHLHRRCKRASYKRGRI
jgi:hypothetical protein